VDTDFSFTYKTHDNFDHSGRKTDQQMPSRNTIDHIPKSSRNSNVGPTRTLDDITVKDNINGTLETINTSIINQTIQTQK
jgi:hypothetical protein